MAHQKKSANRNEAGKGLLIALLILALIGAAVAGWLYFGKERELASSMPPPSETVQGDVIPPTEQPPEAATAGTTPPSPAVALPPAKIDVAAATGVRALGDPKAPVKIIEYFSLTCSHCAHFHNDVLPEMKTKYIDSGKVYIEFREFPLNDPALKASLTARCLPEDKYDGFVGLLFKTQDHWSGGLEYMKALKQNAKLAGMSDETFDACQTEPQLKLKIAEEMQVAKDKWKIDSTPTFIINDGAEKISGAQPLAEFERVFRKVTNDAVGQAPAVQ